MPPIYYGSAPFALKRGAQALKLYYGSTLISGGATYPLMFNAAEQRRLEKPYQASNGFANRGGVTLSVWVKTTDAGTSRMVVYSESTTATTNPYCELTLNDGVVNNVKMLFVDSAGAAITLQSAATVINDGEWHNIIFRSNSPSGHSLWVDGVSVATSAANRNTANYTALNLTTIGANRILGVADGFFTGSIRDLAIFGNPVLDANIAAIYAKTISPIFALGVMTQMRQFYPLASNRRDSSVDPNITELLTAAGSAAIVYGEPGPSGGIVPAGMSATHSSTAARYIPCGTLTTIAEAGAIGSDSRLIREIGNIVYDPVDAVMPYKMYYSAGPSPYNNSNTSTWMSYATSLSGPWTKYPTAVIPVATLGTEDPYVVFDSGTYHLWAENKTGASNAFGICHFTSTDGVSWTRQDSNGSPALAKDPTTGWDNTDVSSPVVWKEAGTWYMLYEGRGTTVTTGRVGLATASDPNGPWTKDAANPVYSGNASTWEAYDIVPDDIRKVGSTYELLFHGTASGFVGVGVVKSTSLTTGWTRNVPNQLFGRSYNFEAMWHPDLNKLIAVNGDLGSSKGDGSIYAWQLAFEQ